MTDDLGAGRAKIEEQLRWIDSMMVGPAGEKPSVVLNAPEARTLLQHIDAQAARLAAVEAKRNALLARLGVLIIETDVTCACCQGWVDTLQAAVSLQGSD